MCIRDRFSTWCVKAWNWAGNKLKKAWYHIRAVFDKDFDKQAAIRSADAAYEAGIRRLEQERDAKIKAREMRRQRERERSRQVHEATMAQIGREHSERERALDAEQQAKIKAAEDAVLAARKEWQEAVDEAARKRQKKQREQEDKGPKKLKKPPGLDELMSRVGDIATNFAKATDRITVRGTFSTAAAWGLAASSTAAERTAKATEDTARNTKKINDEQKHGQRFA